MWQSSWVAKAVVTSKPYARTILPTAPAVRPGREGTETANAEAPALWHERIEDGKGGGSDGKEDVDRRPVNDTHRPGNVQRLMVLRYLPHNAADAGDRTDGEEEADAEFLGRRHLNFIEYDEWYAQERKVQGDVDDAEGYAGGVRVDALGFGFE